MSAGAGTTDCVPAVSRCHCETSVHTGCGNLVQELPTAYKPAVGDCTRKGYAASVTLVPRERLRYHVASLLAMTKRAPFRVIDM